MRLTTLILLDCHQVHWTVFLLKVSVQAAPNDTQQEVGAALAKCLMLTQRHPRAHDLSDAFKDNLQAKAEEIDMVAREAAEQVGAHVSRLPSARLSARLCISKILFFHGC